MEEIDTNLRQAIDCKITQGFGGVLFAGRLRQTFQSGPIEDAPLIDDAVQKLALAVDADEGDAPDRK